MSLNYISRGEVITFTVDNECISGNPYRINGFNGVALFDVEKGDLLSFQLEGIFEFRLDGVSAGDVIYFDPRDNTLSNQVKGIEMESEDGKASGYKPISVPYGRAVTRTGSDGKFHCRLQQNFNLR